MKKRIVSLILALAMVFSLSAVANAASHPFTDVPDGVWYSRFVEYAYAHNLMSGTSATTFHPHTTMNRAMVVTVLYSVAGNPDHSGINPFTDIPGGKWYTDAVLWAVEQGITAGTSETTFSPNTFITREQLVTFLFAYAKKLGAQASDNDLSGYGDYASISGYARIPFAWAVAEGIVSGTDATHLSPKKTATRAECATIMTAFDQWRLGNEEEPDVSEPTEPETTEHTHHYTEKVTNPTCTEKGYTTYTCACGDSYIGNEVAANGHNWDAGVVTKEPTEKDMGLRTFTCKVCGEKKTENIPELGHTHKYTSKVTQPTCTAKGYTTYTCTCGDSYTGDEVAAKGHIEVVDKAVSATCTATGLTEGKHCSVCNTVLVKQETVPALGHSWDNGVVTKEPTEEATGIRTFTCKTCKATKTENIPELGHTHKYTSAVTAPTCTEKGYTTYTCTCGDSYTGNEVAAKGHTEVVDKAVAATCTATGLTEGKHCSVCNTVTVKQETVPALGHSWDTGVVTKEPTEEATGIRTFTCKTCKATKTENIPELGHTHKYTSKVTQPTCTEKGYTTYTCACGNSYTGNEVAAKGHTEVVDKAVAATCTATGLTEGKHCSVCNTVLVKQEVVAALGHSWDDGVVTKEPTEEATGIRTFACQICKTTKTENIPELGHTHKYTSKVTQPTCTAKGYTTYTCTCGDSYTGNEVAAKGHTEVVDKAVAATCTVSGLTEGKHCSVCNVVTVKQNTVPAKGHTDVIDAAKEATCTQSGLTEGKHCSVCNTVLVKQENVPAKGHSYKNGVCTSCGAKDPNYVPPAPGKNPEDVTYEEYLNMSAEEQKAHMNSFDSIEDFFAWHDDAEAKYKEEHPDIEIGGDGNVDLGG